MDSAHVVAIIAAIASLLNIGVTVIGGVVFAVRLEGKIDVQGVRLKALEGKADLTQTIITNNAVQDQRLLQMQRELDGLKRGEGFIGVSFERERS